MKEIRSDVLIIGSGGAGVRAAIAANEKGADVLVVAKTFEGKAHTVMAEGGINAALCSRDPDDSWESHFRDTVEEGVFLNNQVMAEILAREVIDRVHDLEHYGFVFDRTESDKIAQRPFGGQSHPRTCHQGDTTGHELIMTLVDEARRRRIRYMPEISITALLPAKDDSGKIAGAFGIDIKTGEYLVFCAKAVILATGGSGRVFKVTSNPHDSTGDGYAMALRMGAVLQDMEQTQFHPTGMVHPDTARGMLVTEAIRGEGGHLLNSEGKRFMSDYNPEQMELSPRDQTARANYLEIQAGRTSPHGGVFLDIRHKGKDYIMERLPRMVHQFEQFAGVDILTQPMEVAPTAHHFMGGVRVDPRSCESTEISGLFACGECAGGVHGANRLGGNALAETQVFGKRAGDAAGDYAATARLQPYQQAFVEDEVARIEGPLGSSGVSPSEIKHEMQDIMWAHAGIVRDEGLLKSGLSMIEALCEKEMRVEGTRRYNLQWHEYMDVKNMLLVCRTVLLSAIERRESRGAHFRSDHPRRNDEAGLVNYLCRMDGDRILTDSSPVEITALEPVKRRGD